MPMQFPYGEIVTEVPANFVPPEMWPEYGHVADPVKIFKRESVGDNPKGVRWFLWPFCIEEYFGNIEPDMQKSRMGTLAYNRVLQWKRISRMDVPQGWFALSKKPSRIDGVYILGDADVTNAWNKNARRDLRIWQETHLNKTHSIEEISFEEYGRAYKKSIISKRVGNDRLYDLERKFLFPEARPHITLWGVRNIQTKEVVAGTAVVSSPTFKNSTHFSPFICEEGKNIFAATGLIYQWFSTAQQKGFTYAMTINFWYPGQPKDWKGFSEFKSHFGFKYIAYPPELIRFARGKLF